MGRDPRLMTLPSPIPPSEAGRTCRSGWLAPDGRFWPAGYGEHVAVGVLLSRLRGDWPRDRRGRADLRRWVQVRGSGEAVILTLTQAQRDALGDMLAAAPASVWRGRLAQSLRQHDRPEEQPRWLGREERRASLEVLRYLEAAGCSGRERSALRRASSGG
jgi:hypothetical protein